MKTVYKLICVSMFAAFISQGCVTTQVRRTTDELVSDGESLYKEGRYDKAIIQWKRVKESYPSPEVSARVELGIADAYFQNKDYIEASAEYEGFRKLHPKHERAGYALYKLALCYYMQIKTIDTDQTPVKNSLFTFESYLMQYPGGEYRAEVRQKMLDCRDRQLQYEIYVGSYYLRTGKPKSGIARFETALRDFPDLKRRDEVLFFLGRAYLDDNQKVKCSDTVNRLLREYPDTLYAKEARKLLGNCL